MKDNVLSVDCTSSHHMTLFANLLTVLSVIDQLSDSIDNLSDCMNRADVKGTIKQDITHKARQHRPHNHEYEG